MKESKFESLVKETAEKYEFETPLTTDVLDEGFGDALTRAAGHIAGMSQMDSTKRAPGETEESWLRRQAYTGAFQTGEIQQYKNYQNGYIGMITSWNALYKNLKTDTAGTSRTGFKSTAVVIPNLDVNNVQGTIDKMDLRYDYPIAKPWSNPRKGSNTGYVTEDGINNYFHDILISMVTDQTEVACFSMRETSAAPVGLPSGQSITTYADDLYAYEIETYLNTASQFFDSALIQDDFKTILSACQPEMVLFNMSTGLFELKNSIASTDIENIVNKMPAMESVLFQTKTYLRRFLERMNKNGSLITDMSMIMNSGIDATAPTAEQKISLYSHMFGYPAYPYDWDNRGLLAERYFNVLPQRLMKYAPSIKENLYWLPPNAANAVIQHANSNLLRKGWDNLITSPIKTLTAPFRAFNYLNRKIQQANAWFKSNVSSDAQNATAMRY